MLPRSAVPISHDTRASRTHIFSDRHLIKLRFVQTQNLYRHCPRSAFFISAREYIYQAPAPCRCLCRMPPELRPNKGRIEGVWSLSYASAGKPTTPLSRLLWLPPFGNSENLVNRSDGLGQTTQGTSACRTLARHRLPRNVLRTFPTNDATSMVKNRQSGEYLNSSGGNYQQQLMPEGCYLTY